VGRLEYEWGDTAKLARIIIECLNHAEIEIVDQTHSFPSFAKQIKAFRAFHNVLVIDKGDNCEPSNFAYDLNNPDAANAIRIIEQELEKAPTAEGMANLCDLYLRGGNLQRAKETADRALSLWSENASLLMAAYGVAIKQNDASAKVNYLERILQIEPDNVAMQHAMEQARAELKQLGDASLE
jgi:tetratricopeptide (TPR) repeat protein